MVIMESCHSPDQKASVPRIFPLALVYGVRLLCVAVPVSAFSYGRFAREPRLPGDGCCAPVPLTPHSAGIPPCRDPGTYPAHNALSR